jgi:hypothetical protein
MSTQQKQENRGGLRAGAGRKPGLQTSLAAAQVEKMLRKARRAAKKHGKDVDDVLLEFVYSVQEKTRDRLAAIKLWKDFSAVKITEGGETDKALGPAVFLPSQRPTLSVVDGKKSA